MAYFPNAFKKVFFTFSTSFVTTGKTDLLGQGDIGFFSPKTWTAIPQAQASVAQHPQAVFVMGNYHNIDKIGSHGGYMESVKSQPIDPRYIHRFYKVIGRDAQPQYISVGYDQTNATTAPSFEKGKQYLLRIDLKGSPLLRFLGRNAYHTFDASTGCADTCVDPCTPAAKVDPVTVLLQWRDQIHSDPIFSNFITAHVYYDNGTGLAYVGSDPYVPATTETQIAAIKAGMEIQVGYWDTRFGDCSFDVRDHFEMEPIEVQASLVDESGDPCKIPYLSVKETQAPRSADGTGDQILRDLILSNRYRQEHYQTDNRRKEIEDVIAVTHNLAHRNSVYTSYYILHSVPRKSNPSATLDADQYLIQLSVPKTYNMTAFENWLQAYLTSAGSGVKLENLSLSGT